MIYSINYDLKKPGRDYTGLYEAIKGCGVWWHYLDSTWLVETNLSGNQIWSKLQPHIDQNDSVLIAGMTNDTSGWLPQKAWEWINSHRVPA